MNGLDLKRLREEKGVSQQQLSEATGVKRGTIGRIEASGEEIKKVDVLTAFNKFFKTEQQSVAEERRIAPYGDTRWIDPNLSVMENLQKIIDFKREGLITETEFNRIKSKIIPKD